MRAVITRCLCIRKRDDLRPYLVISRLGTGWCGRSAKILISRIRSSSLCADNDRLANEPRGVQTLQCESSIRLKNQFNRFVEVFSRLVQRVALRISAGQL